MEIKATTLDNLPLRCFLLYPKCERLLTGSASRGGNASYFYYHCNSACGIRFKAPKVNESFKKEPQRFIPRIGVAELYKLVVKDIFQKEVGKHSDQRKELSNLIQAGNDCIAKALKLLLDDGIDSGDYRKIKQECESKIHSKEAKLNDCRKPTFNIDECLNKALAKFSNLGVLYKEANVTNRRLLIGSIYPQKLCFDGASYRTAYINEADYLIYLINKKLEPKKSN